MFLIEDSTKVEEITGDNLTGLVERNFDTHPIRMSALEEFPELIPESDYDAWIDEGEEQESFLDHIRDRGMGGKPIPSLSQASTNYCWSHSPTSGHILLRAAANQEYVPLSACAVAAKLMNGRNQGGWAALAMEFITSKGQPTTEFFPAGTTNLRAYDKPATWKNAERFKISEGYWDLAAPVYRRNLTIQQIFTLLLRRIPVALDFAWWGHSVCGMKVVRVERGSYGIKIWNSWADSWGDNGTAVIRGEKIYPMGAVAPRSASASTLKPLDPALAV